jgi:hypothetical protein
MEPLSPKEVIELLAHKIGWSNRRQTRYQGVPGEMIHNLSPERRAILQNLKSSDLAELTDVAKLSGYIGPFYQGADYYLDGHYHLSDDKISQEKLDFDRKLHLDLRRTKDRLPL